jgi:hypothetical protein
MNRGWAGISLLDLAACWIGARHGPLHSAADARTGPVASAMEKIMFFRESLFLFEAVLEK